MSVALLLACPHKPGPCEQHSILRLEDRPEPVVQSGDRTQGVVNQGRQGDTGLLTEGVCLRDVDRQLVAPMCPAQVAAMQKQEFAAS